MSAPLTEESNPVKYPPIEESLDALNTRLQDVVNSIDAVNVPDHINIEGSFDTIDLVRVLEHIGRVLERIERKL